MNKHLLIMIILLSLISCGKKGDPEYKAINYNQSINFLI